MTLFQLCNNLYIVKRGGTLYHVIVHRCRLVYWEVRRFYSWGNPESLGVYETWS